MDRDVWSSAAKLVRWIRGRCRGKEMGRRGVLDEDGAERRRKEGKEDGRFDGKVRGAGSGEERGGDGLMGRRVGGVGGLGMRAGIRRENKGRKGRSEVGHGKAGMS